jgi:phosphoserine phosphatase
MGETKTQATSKKESSFVRDASAALTPSFLFDLDGTLVDSVYQHVLAWREALEQAGIQLAVWRIHRRIGMSGGLFVNALLREIGTAPKATLRSLHLAGLRWGLIF